MSRRVITIAAIVIGFGALVAYVRAQDSATRSVLRSINEPSQEPTLASPPSSARRIEETGNSRYSIGDAGDTATSPTRRTTLADRLQQVRDSASTARESSSQSAQTSPIARPLLGSPTVASPLSQESSQGATIVSSPRVADERGAVTTDRTGNAVVSDRYAPRRIPRAPVPTAPSAGAPFVTGPSIEESPSDVSDEAPVFVDPAAEEPQPRFETTRPPTSRPPVDISLEAGSLINSVGPQLRVETTGPRSIKIGKPAEYHVTVENLGAVAANEIYVRITLPAWVEVKTDNVTSGSTQKQAEDPGQQKVIWTVDQVAPQSRQTLKLTALPTSNRPFDLLVDWTLRPITGMAQIEVQQPRLELAVFGPKDVLYGDSAVYTIQLTNPGTGAADNVALEFSYGAQRLEKKIIGLIAAGQQNEVNVELTAQQAGQLRVAAVATADGGLRAEANEDILVRRAALEVGVVGSSLKFAGGVATYKVRVKNTGNATANGVMASIALPPGAKLLGAEQSESGTILQDVGALIPGGERTLGIQCQLMTPGDNRIDAVVKSESGLEKSASFTTRVEALADLKLTVSDPRGPTPLGTDAVYEVHVINRGTKAAERIKIIAQFSEGVEPLEASGGVAEIVPGQVLFQPISRIEPGAEVVLKIIARADAVGNHRFRAELTAADPDTRLIAEETTYFFGEEATRTATRSSGAAATQ